VHEIAARALSRWPREVFEKNEKKYVKLLEE
jgi:hypothetical protein